MSNFKVDGCRNCPFYVNERDLDKCFHPFIESVSGENRNIRFGRNVFDFVKYNAEFKIPNWCPLNKNSITIEKQDNL